MRLPRCSNMLDIMMPKIDGLEVLKRLRAGGCSTPILLLTAKSQIEDQIMGLDMGADDYLPKPFSMKLLLARVRAMLRRRNEFTPDILRCGNISLNQQSYALSCGNQTVVLPKLEYQLMELLNVERRHVSFYRGTAVQRFQTGRPGKTNAPTPLQICREWNALRIHCPLAIEKMRRIYGCPPIFLSFV